MLVLFLYQGLDINENIIKTARELLQTKKKILGETYSVTNSYNLLSLKAYNAPYASHIFSFLFQQIIPKSDKNLIQQCTTELKNWARI